MNRVWLQKHQSVAAFVVVAFCYFAMHQYHGVGGLPYDSGLYWSLSYLPGYLDFPLIMRGYFYAAVLVPMRWFSDAFVGAGLMPMRVGFSVLYAFLLAVMVPNMCRDVFGGRVSFVRRLIVPALMAAIFPGLLLYPLTDLPALSMAMISVWCVVIARGRAGGVYALLVAIGGFMAYGAYNTRTIYIFPLALIFLGTVLFRHVPTTWQKRLYTAAIFIVGALLASIPQANINLRHHGFATPAVLAQGENGGSLFAAQLAWGLTVQRYETSVSPESPGAAVYYADRAGSGIVAGRDINRLDFGPADYLGIVAAAPVEFLGLLGRHFVNGLDVRDGEAYMTGHSPDNHLLALANFCVVFLGISLLVRWLWVVDAQRSFEKLYWLFTLLVPVAAILPGAVETRFFLPLHMAIYCYIAFSANAREIASFVRRKWIPISVIFGVTALMFFAVSTNTMSSITYVNPSDYNVF